MLREQVRPLDPQLLAHSYLSAKEQVIVAGFASEIDWQDSIALDDLNESTFLRESAWVVLSCGFRESVLRQRFADISVAFLSWANAKIIAANSNHCREDALLVFRNPRKIDGILSIVNKVASEGINAIRSKIKRRGVDFIREFPFMGPVTAYHLAKNLGVEVVKPDRHLVRLAEVAGYSSPECMCRRIAEYVGDSLQVIDLVLWRYASITKNYRALFPKLPSWY